MKTTKRFHAIHGDNCGGLVDVQRCSEECGYADVARCARCGELFVFPCPVHTPGTEDDTTP